ncbi:MAG TPA: acetyl-CoA hydrolase/transferase C-terminal domain-containing protein [Xanthobacteraceae bacterium]|nr:acetyl-CoA hydrolase/transferase C-terminal domain-containing protein [Xanthobacteraceae bacterium]
MSASPTHYDSADKLADDIIRDVGKKIVLALPLGLGKANNIANALFKRAAADPSLSLTIFTALTLEKPHPKNEIEARFIGPVIERLFGDYPDFLYAKALRERSLPENIRVNEFFLLAGKWLHHPVMQQNYIAANYTHAMRYLLERGVNVAAQLVARKGERYSLSCNPDITLDLLRERAAGRADFRIVAEVNENLPFMPNDAEVPPETFSAVLESPASNFPLFAPPYEPIDLEGYAIGLNAARLVADGGTLQIGIGQEGDAAAYGLILRQHDNAVFRDAIKRLDGNRPPPAGHQEGGFEQGLHGLSEMFVASFAELIKAGVVKRECDGYLMEGGFFVGPKAFYEALRGMDEKLLAKINMTAISWINELYGDEDKKRRARGKARFINNAMLATLMGAVVSDGLETGGVVSGVGGQYNFVSQAFALPDARSIITMHSKRGEGRKATSNIRWRYGHQTIPRHLRDIVVSEYGVADLRGKDDQDVIAAMLSIADSRFQDELLRAAKDAGKLPKHYEIPVYARDNTPERIEQALGPLREQGKLPAFPFGSDFDATELRLIPALKEMQRAAASPFALLDLVWEGMGKASAEEKTCLARIGLDRGGFKNKLYAALLRGALRTAREL